MDLSAFDLGHVRSVRVIAWGMSGRDVVEVDLEIEDEHGALRVAEAVPLGAGVTPETIKAWERALNAALAARPR